MKIPIFQVDAFTSELFRGNPAAVCLLEEWVTDDVMQEIAAENNLSETAFVNINENPMKIRWFTPTVEVDLCGHATLAAARILFDKSLHKNNLVIEISSNSGTLKAFIEEDLIFLDFPADIPKPADMNQQIIDGLGKQHIELYIGRDDFLAIFNDEKEIINMNLNFTELKKLSSRGIIISAQGNKADFVSRCFYPQTGVDEDPVTGSAHTLLTPFWARKLDKTKFFAQQLSVRGGELICHLKEDRVLIGGKTIKYLEGEITI